MPDGAHAQLPRLAQGGDFGHRKHPEVAWTLLAREGAPAETITRLLRAFAASHGVPGRFHATLTEAWVRVVAHHRSRVPGRWFEEFLALHPVLLDPGLIPQHYRGDVAADTDARRAWLEPDLRPLPVVA